MRIGHGYGDFTVPGLTNAIGYGLQQAGFAPGAATPFSPNAGAADDCVTGSVWMQFPVPGGTVQIAEYPSVAALQACLAAIGPTAAAGSESAGQYLIWVNPVGLIPQGVTAGIVNTALAQVPGGVPAAAMVGGAPAADGMDPTTAAILCGVGLLGILGLLALSRR